MPQAQDWLEEQFSDDWDAMQRLDRAFSISDDFIIRPRRGITPTADEWDAVQYLLEAFDFGLDEGPEPEEII